jgi:hypothetical protein
VYVVVAVIECRQSRKVDRELQAPVVLSSLFVIYLLSFVLFLKSDNKSEEEKASLRRKRGVGVRKKIGQEQG